MTSIPAKTPDLEQMAAHYQRQAAQLKRRIIICGATGCIANGALKVRDAVCAEMEKAGQKRSLTCWSMNTTAASLLLKERLPGFCRSAIMRIEPEGIFYCHVKPEDAAEIVNVTLKTGEIIDRLVYVDPVSKAAAP